MSLYEKLSVIDKKKYQPIYSAKIENRNSRKHFLDDIKFKTKNLKKTTSSIIVDCRRMSSFLASEENSVFLVDNSQEVKSLTLNKKENDLDSINLSLLSLNSDEFVVNREKYGKFKYSSYFERYMNRRALVKIQFMPKLENDGTENNPDVTIFEMLAPDESKNLYLLYEIMTAKPPRIRSNSMRNIENVFNSKKQRRYKSLDQERTLKDNYQIVAKKTFEKKQLQPEKDNLLLDDIEEQFDVRAIKAPHQTYGWENAFYIPEVHKVTKKQPYSHIKSKLASNLTQNQHHDETKMNSSESCKAIATHDVYKKEYVVYSQHAETELKSFKTKRLVADSLLKIDSELKERIRIDLKVNRGPIYFVQLTEENLNIHNENKNKVSMTQKYFNLFNWLKTINVEECTHFYANPFFLDKTNGTEEQIDLVGFQNANFPEPNSKQNISFRAQTRYKIDPFKNVTNETIIDKLPKKHRSDLNNERTFYETQDKQTFVWTKNFKNMLQFNNRLSFRSARFSDKATNVFDHDKIFELSKNRLRKQKDLNDRLFATAQLDLFIL